MKRVEEKTAPDHRSQKTESTEGKVQDTVDRLHTLDYVHRIEQVVVAPDGRVGHHQEQQRLSEMWHAYEEQHRITEPIEKEKRQAPHAEPQVSKPAKSQFVEPEVKKLPAKSAIIWPSTKDFVLEPIEEAVTAQKTKVNQAGVASESSVVEASFDLLPDLPDITAESYDWFAQQELALPADLDQEIELFWRDQQAQAVESSYLESAPDFASEFSDAEAAELDAELGFEPILVVPVEKRADTQGIESVPEPEFAEIVRAQIEDMSEREAPKMQEAFAELEIIEKLAVEFADIQFGNDNPDSQKLEELQEQLLEHAEKLLALMDKKSDKRMVKRFVERVIMSELESRSEARRKAQEKGTHEQKLFEDNLLWARAKSSSENIAQYVGSFAVARSRFAHAA